MENPEDFRLLEISEEGQRQLDQFSKSQVYWNRGDPIEKQCQCIIYSIHQVQSYLLSQLFEMHLPWILE